MKKAPFICFLIIELFADLIAMGLLFSDVGPLIYLIAAAIFAVVLAPFFVCLKKTEDEGKKAKIRRSMLLIMLIPIAVATIAVVAVITAMLLYF